MKEHPKPHPPRLALRWLRFFCMATWADDIEGDLRQYYVRRIETHGKRRADLLFWRDVMLLFRPGLIRSFRISQKLNIMDLFRHSMVVAFRNFRKYSGSFLINLLGLTSGLAAVLLIYLWVDDELKMDKHHVNDERLYQLLENVDQGTGMLTRESTAGPTARGLVEGFPEVDRAVTTTWISDYTLSHGDKSLIAEGIWVSEDYFQVFTMPLMEGRAEEVLKENNSIVISEDLAQRMFGTTEGLIGRMVKLQQEESYQVTGVYRNHSRSASLAWDFFVPFQKFYDDNEWMQNWFNTAPQTYILFHEGVDVVAFNEKVKDLIIQKTDSSATHRKPFAAKYSDRYLYGRYENGAQVGGRIEYVRIFSAIALFVLLIACINFMNLSTARASRRLKEIGIKKTVGASRVALIVQFLTESFVMVGGAILIGMLLVWLILPQFNELTDKRIVFELWGPVLIFGLMITIVTGFVAGSYPALYLSRFRPALVLKGKLYKSTGESWARKGLVIFQFTLSVILIVAVVVVYQQLDYTQSINLGYSKEHTLRLTSDGAIWDSVTYQTYVHEIQTLPYVLEAAGSTHSMIGHNGGTYGVRWPGKDPNDRTEFESMHVTPGFLEMMDIEIVEGRSYSKLLASDRDKVIFNQAGIDFMGFDKPIGRKVVLWGQEVEIIGVVKDFNFNSLHEVVKPAFLRPMYEPTRYVMAKLEPGKEREAIEAINEVHASLNPGFELRYSFLDEAYNRMYRTDHRVSSLASYFAGIAIIISCLGLFGLASFTLERRSKEIGIRKILGSSRASLLQLLTLGLTQLVLLAIVLGLPISYFIASKWLENFAFTIDLEWWFFVGAGVVTVLIAVLTVGLQAIKATLVSPVSYLRDE
ncbi:MAG: ABC transporter permease [Bacteroidota bacterium]